MIFLKFHKNLISWFLAKTAKLTKFSSFKVDGKKNIKMSLPTEAAFSAEDKSSLD